MFPTFLLRSLAAVAALTMLATTAPADMFGSGANQFTLEFVPISGSTNPTPAQANDTSRGLDGFGIVEYDYRTGKYEVTNDQWNKFVAAYGAPTGNPSTAYGVSFYDWGTGTVNVPANNVSRYEAAQFVNWLNTSTGHQAAYKFTGTQGTDDYRLVIWDPAEAWGGTNLFRHKNAYYFLPDENEWFKAAYWNGTEIQDYATKAGETLHQGDGSSDTGWNYWDDGYATNPYGPWNVGTGSEELNGTYDMMGNIWERMESRWDDDPPPGAGWTVAARGGHFSGYSNALAASSRTYDNPASAYSFGGFRVASVPEPGSVVLLLTGAMSGLIWWKRRK